MTPDIAMHYIAKQRVVLECVSDVLPVLALPQMLTFTFFASPQLRNSFFSKINPLTYNNAVFTSGSPVNRRIYGMLHHVARSPEAYSTYFEILLQYIGPGTNTHFPIYRHFWLHTKIDKKISDPRRGMRFAPYYAAN